MPNIRMETAEEKRRKYLIKYGTRWRCELCHGEWDTKKRSLNHFNLHDPAEFSA